MSYDVRILADSVSPDGVRLTTMQLTYPRFIHSELMTHRMFSRNAASSRAIPTEKNIERVRVAPFVPETFNRRVKGMGVGDALDDKAAADARFTWLTAAAAAADQAEKLNEIGIDKSRANRLLEPFLWMTTIVSATEWSNFFALRDHPAAQPEFQILARKMRTAMDFASTPVPLEEGYWHLPLVTEEELADLCEHRRVASEKTGEIRKEFDAMVEALAQSLAMVSAGRCARVSFDTHENFEQSNVSYQRAEKLMTSGHFSPFEHPARPATRSDVHQLGFDGNDPYQTADNHFFANFRGWVQLRGTIPNESDFSKVEA